MDLSEKGVEEACKAGDALREAGFSLDVYKRQRTYNPDLGLNIYDFER